MLKVEQWKEKVLLYKDLVSQVDGGIAATSHTWAKKHIFNWTDDEIKIDLEQQRMERAASKELENTPEVIKKTGYFERVDKLYGEIGGTPTEGVEGGTEGTEGGDLGGGGGFGGGSFGGGGDFGGDLGGDMGGDLGGEEGGLGGDMGGEESGTETGGTETGFGESFRYKNKSIIDKLLMEGIRKNEDIMMMTDGIKHLIGDDTVNEEEDDDDFDLLR